MYVSHAANRMPNTADWRQGPILLGCSQRQGEEEVRWNSLPQHRDEDQVQLDVNRSFVYYPERKIYQAETHCLVQLCPC